MSSSSSSSVSVPPCMPHPADEAKTNSCCCEWLSSNFQRWPSRKLAEALSHQGQTWVGISNLAAVFPTSFSSSSSLPADGLVNQHERCLRPREATSNAEVKAAPPSGSRDLTMRVQPVWSRRTTSILPISDPIPSDNHSIEILQVEPKTFFAPNCSF